MYKSLDKKAITVMRINAVILGLLAGLITAVVLYIYLTNINKDALKIVALAVSLIVLIPLILNIILFPNIRYKRYKYLVTEEKIEVKKGLFWITRTIIQIKRIQKIEISSGPVDRKFNLENLDIYTAAGKESIRFLNQKEAKELSEEINNLLKKCLEKTNEK